MIEMDNLSISSGRISEATADRERNKLAQETKGDNEMTLMRLRRLSRTVMCKSEPHRFEARKLQRSNIVKYLESHLVNPSDKVRYLALELFCCTIPRLANKTDSLLKPLLPKVFQCLQKKEKKEMKLKALHFLRCFFRHAKSLSGCIDSFVKLGIENPDAEIQFSCCLGLNIVFDQDIGNSLFSLIVTSVANILIQRNKLELKRAAYRALKNIHKTIKDSRFFDLLNVAHPQAAELYKSMFAFEETDSFMGMENTDCSFIILEYQIKRRYLNLKKDFGILDPIFLHQIRQTRNCERASTVSNLVLALKQTPWTDEDLDPHILDFLKVVNSFICDANRLVQMSGFDILKEIINRMSFTLAPQIQWITDILRKGLTSANTKIKSKVERVLHKLMHKIHPMTVMWNLLNTKSDLLKEAVIIFIQNKLSHFPYHEIDMVALCNCLGQSLEDSNTKLTKCSRDCIILLLDIMHDCPAYGIRTQAIRVLLRNHKLNTQTVKDIGIIGSTEDEYYQEDFESYSDEETTDRESASISVGSTATGISVAMSGRSISTAGASDIRFTDACSDLSLLKSCKSLCESASCSHLSKNHEANNNNLPKEERMSINLDLHSQTTIQTAINWKENLIASTNKARESFSVESSGTSSGKELSLSSRTDSIPSRYIFSASGNPNTSRQQWVESVTPDSIKSFPEFKTDSNLHLNSENHPSRIHTTSQENYFIENESGISQFADIIVSENIDVLQKLNSSHKPRKYFTRFCMKTDAINFANEFEKLAAGDSNAVSKNMAIVPQKSETDSKIIYTSYEQNGIQVDVMNKNFFNFNIMEISHTEAQKSIEDLNHTEYADRNPKTNETLTKIREIASQTDKNTTPQKTENVQENMVPKFVLPSKMQIKDEEVSPELFVEVPQLQNNAQSQDFVESDIYIHTRSDFEASNESMDNGESCSEITNTEKNNKCREATDTQTDLLCYESDVARMGQLSENLSDKGTDATEKNQFSHADSSNEEVTVEIPIAYSKDFDDIDKPFMPKNRELPRTPVETKPGYTLEVQPKLPKSCKKHRVSNKRKIALEKIREKKETGLGSHSEESEKSFKKPPVGTPVLNGTDGKTGGQVKHNSPSKWGGCQWRRDLEYAAKAAPCPWADKFENVVQSMKPFASSDVAENEMKKAIEDLYGNSWKKKEEAMLTVIQLTKHHPEVVQDNASKIVVALSNEIKNFRQSVAGKAILTAGHLYEIMGKNFENKLRLVVAALLAKSGNRTLAAYFRLVIKSLFKIMNSTTPQKVIIALIHEGSRHPNKAARETAAQFLTILTEYLGPENSLIPTLSTQLLKCAAMFVADSSALTRHCGKRMFKIFMQNSDFEKLKDHQLDFNTTQGLSKVIEQIKSKGVREEVLPISIIE